MRSERTLTGYNGRGTFIQLAAPDHRVEGRNLKKPWSLSPDAKETADDPFTLLLHSTSYGLTL